MAESGFVNFPAARIGTRHSPRPYQDLLTLIMGRTRSGVKTSYGYLEGVRSVGAHFCGHIPTCTTGADGADALHPGSYCEKENCGIYLVQLPGGKKRNRSYR